MRKLCCTDLCSSIASTTPTASTSCASHVSKRNSTAPQSKPLDRLGLVGPGELNQLSGQPSTGLGQQAQQQLQGSQQAFPGEGKERDEPERLLSTEEGDRKERFRLSQEGAEQARNQLSNSISRAGAWERHAWEDKDEGKDARMRVWTMTNASVVSEGDGTKVWQAKRTLRKLVFRMHSSWIQQN